MQGWIHCGRRRTAQSERNAGEGTVRHGGSRVVGLRLKPDWSHRYTMVVAMSRTGSRCVASLPEHAEAARARSALSAQAWKARPQAEQNRLTQTEEEDTSVQALVRRQLPRSACALPPISEHLIGGQDNQGRRDFFEDKLAR